jgi:putative FmdB family regulatory protein
MPIYEYQCQKCGEIFEVFQKFSDPPPKRHECGGRKIKRLMSQTSFILKGTGWYVTDYARKEQSQKEGKGKDKNTEKKQEKKEKTETKEKSSSDKKGSNGGSKAAA